MVIELHERSPIQSAVIIGMITKSDDLAAGVRFLYLEYVDRIPINHKNYNFREKKTSQDEKNNNCFAITASNRNPLFLISDCLS